MEPIYSATTATLYTLMVEEKSPYELLRVAPTASQDEVRAAYKSTALQNHPDRGGDPLAWAAIQRAYDTLVDAQKRAVYDRTRQGPATNAEASFTQLPEAAGDPQARAIDWITWSILELIRARWSWAGAEATEFIVRFDRKRDLIKSEQKVYPIEAGSAIHHSFRHGGGKGRVKAKPSDGVFTKAVGRGAAVRRHLRVDAGAAQPHRAVRRQDLHPLLVLVLQHVGKHQQLIAAHDEVQLLPLGELAAELAALPITKPGSRK